MFTTNENTITIRNYCIAVAFMLFFCVGTTEIFNSPARFAQQDKIDSYSRYISAGLVNYAQNLVR